MRRILSLLIILIIVFLIVFSGCTQNNSGTNQINDATEQESNHSDNKKSPELSFDIVRPEIIDSRYEFSEGMGLFQYDDKSGYIDMDGKIAIEPKYGMSKCFSEGYAFVSTPDRDPDNRTLLIIDKNKNEIRLPSDYDTPTSSGAANEPSTTHKFVNGVAVVPLKKGAGYAAVNTKGEELFRTTPMGKYYGPVKNSHIFFYHGNPKITVIDSHGKITSEINNVSFSDDHPEVSRDDGLIINVVSDSSGSRRGILDLTGSIILEAEYEKLQPPSEGLIAFKKYGKWGFIDYKGNVVIEPEYENACWFKNGLCAVTKEGKICFIDKNNTIILETEDALLDGIERFGWTYFGKEYYKFNKEGLAVIPVGRQSKIIDKNGNNVLSSNGAFMSADLTENIVCIFDGSPDGMSIYKLSK